MAYYLNTKKLVDWKMDLEKTVDDEGNVTYEQQNIETQGMDVLYANLHNYLSSPRGSRTRMFRPNYGSHNYEIAHTTMTDSATERIKVNLWQDMNAFHPEVKVSMDSIYVVENIEDPERPGYDIQATIRYRGTEDPVSFTLYKLA